MKLFVYGTLRAGEGNHVLLAGATRVAAQAWTTGRMFVFALGGFPVVVPDANRRVYGEVYEVDEETLLRVDRLEGYVPGSKSNFYQRVLQRVCTDEADFDAYLYVQSTGDGLVEVESGDWTLYRWELALKQGRQEVLYFAFGSCMDLRRFEEKGIADAFANVMGVGVLDGYRLRFNHRSQSGYGRANVHECAPGSGQRVEGIVYVLDPQRSDVLDKLWAREGARRMGGFTLGAKQVYRPLILQVEVAGVLRKVLSFKVVNPFAADYAPDRVYAGEILRGASGRLSTGYVSGLEALVGE